MYYTSMTTLNAMQKAGLIKFAPETGCKIGKTTITYIDDTVSGRSEFEFKGRKYKLVYNSGCFYPYVKQVI